MGLCSLPRGTLIAVPQEEEQVGAPLLKEEHVGHGDDTASETYVSCPEECNC